MPLKAESSMPLKLALTLLLAPSLALRAAPVPTTRLRPHHVQQHVPALVMRRSTVPPRMVALPMCPAGGVLSLAVKAGCATVLAQLGLVAAFRSSSDPVLKQAPGYAAHQLVALVVMIYATTFGVLGWLNPPATAYGAAATAAGRLLVETQSAR